MNTDAIMHALSHEPDYKVQIPMATATVDNKRGHRMKLAREAAESRAAVYWALMHLKHLRGTVTAVRVTRVAARSIDQHNEGSALKCVIDGVADALSPARVKSRKGGDRGEDGLKSGISWMTAQEHRAGLTQSVRVEIWT